MIGSRLRKLRLARGLTQRELAAPAYTHAYVSTIESGRRRPSRTALEHFAVKLGVSPEELETGRPADLDARLELRLQEARVAISDGRYEEAATSLNAILKEAKRYGSASLLARAEEGLGLIAERLGRPEEAIDHYQRAEEALAGEPSTARVDAVAGKARSFQSLGDIRYAIHLLESHRDAMTRDGLEDPNANALVAASLIDAYLDAGLVRNAADAAMELERLAPRLTDPRRVAIMHLHTAHLHLVEGRPQEALRSLQRVEDVYRTLGFASERGAAHLARGIVLNREERFAEAREELDRALATFESTGARIYQIRVLVELGRLERLDGRHERARELLERAIVVVGDTDALMEASAHRELGALLMQVDPTGSEKHFRIAIDLYERTEQPVEIAITYRWLGDLMNARGDADAGCDAYRTGILAIEPTV
jgi:tetratricopeptide (TPR) repeat protein